MDQATLWNRFKSYYCHDRTAGFGLDISRMKFSDKFLPEFEARMQNAYESMASLEKGEIANPDEKRMVGHYWLRNTQLAPNNDIKQEIETTLSRIKEFARGVHQGAILTPKKEQFRYLLVVGIGGSALGPQYVTQALGNKSDPLEIYFFDNTDPDGMEKVIRNIPDLSKTLCVVISKSGGTKETRNGQLIARAAWEQAKLDFSKHVVAVTQDGSELDAIARKDGWLARFPMWDWVGGRTSELSAVGLLPAALQGFDIDEMLRGAREMDALTRSRETRKNPAALLALMWYHAGGGKGAKDMVVLPYKDRLELFSKYLQQLMMESLGKEKDHDGKTVNQGVAVYGNKGSTDQHAYVQQLRDGLNNFFAVFVEVLRDRNSIKSVGAKSSKGCLDACKFEVEPGITSGDYLSGFHQGTRQALFENGKESVTITVDEVNERTVGMLIAVFERAVGLYASLININAYHQPGVEAGKKAAAAVLALQSRVETHLKKGSSLASADEIAKAIGETERSETVFKILRHLQANGRVNVERGATVFEDRYGAA